MTKRKARIIIPEPRHAQFDMTHDDELPQIIVVNTAMLACQGKRRCSNEDAKFSLTPSSKD